MKWKIEKDEIKYIIFSLAFAILWFFVILPILSPHLENKNILIQFLIFNLGLYVFFFIFLKSIITKTKANIRLTTGLVFLFLSFDTLMPEYHISLSGELIKGAILGQTATDYLWGSIALGLGFHGILVAFITYVVFPAIMLFISAILIKNFVRIIE